MNASHHQMAAAQQAYDNRSPVELSINEEDFLERETVMESERLAKAVAADLVVTDLTDKFAEIDAEQLFHLMHLAETGRAVDLVKAVRKITADCIEELADHLATVALHRSGE